jgi:hypothetical protein
MMKKAKPVPSSANPCPASGSQGAFQRKAPLSVSPDAIAAIGLFAKAESSFNRGCCENLEGYVETVSHCKEIIAKYSGALSGGHRQTLVDAYLMLGKSLFHLGRDEEAYLVLSRASEIVEHPEVSEWLGICRKKASA